MKLLDWLAILFVVVIVFATFAISIELAERGFQPVIDTGGNVHWEKR